jgi:hypothetical protein
MQQPPASAARRTKVAPYAESAEEKDNEEKQSVDWERLSGGVKALSSPIRP